jgi:hypothetical protein
MSVTLCPATLCSNMFRQSVQRWAGMVFSGNFFFTHFAVCLRTVFLSLHVFKVFHE